MSLLEGIERNLPDLSHLQCDLCEYRESVTKREAAAYTLGGRWPTCPQHGKQLRLVTLKERQAVSS